MDVDAILYAVLRTPGRKANVKDLPPVGFTRSKYPALMQIQNVECPFPVIVFFSHFFRLRGLHDLPPPSRLVFAIARLTKVEVSWVIGGLSQVGQLLFEWELGVDY